MKLIGRVLIAGACLSIVAVLGLALVVNRETNKPLARTAPRVSAGTCISASLSGQTLVNGLDDVALPAFPGAKRLTYADGNTAQYVAKAADRDILGYYQERLTSLCWQVAEQTHNRVVYKKGGESVQLALLANPVSGKTVIDYRLLGVSRVLGDIVCSADQVKCWDSSGSTSWCQTGPCPTPYPSSGSGTPASCSDGMVMCYGSGQSSGWCQMPPCPSSTPYQPPTCSGSYQQSGQTSPSCNYSSCPNGCSWGPDGCPSGCYTPPATITCSGSAQQPNINYPSCNYGTCPNGCSWGPDGCPNGCNSSTGPMSGSSCAAGQYWCNGACISSGSYCAPSGGSGNMGTQEECTRNGGLWCQPSTAPHCHGGPNPGPCETDTAYQSSCASGQYMCNGACIPTNTTCSPTMWPNDPASCSTQGKTWCTPSYGGAGWCQSGQCPSATPGSSCPSGQYWCNGACISNSSTCSPTMLPTDQASCTAQGKIWCYPSTAGSSGWCQSYGSCPSPTPMPSCGVGQYMCNGACIPTNTTCSPTMWPNDPASCNAQGKTWCMPSTGGGAGWCQSTGPCPSPTPVPNCGAGMYFCNSTNNCVAFGTNCPSSPTPSPYPNPQPTPLPNTQPTPAPNCGSGTFYCEMKQTCLPMGTPCETKVAPQPIPTSVEQKAENEQEMKRRQEEQLRMMKQRLNEFTRGFEQLKKLAERMKPRLARVGVGVPAELTNALARAPELVAKIKAATTVEEVEDAMFDLQDIGQTMQEWGPRFGDLMRLGDMLQQAQKTKIKELTRAQARVKGYVKTRPELTELVADLNQLAQDMTRAVADAKELAKTDPEAALDKLDDDFYGHMEEFWNLVATIDMVRDLRRGLRQADSEIRRADQTIRALERKKAPAETIAQLKDLVGQIKTLLPQLREILKQRPVDYEALRDAAEEFWQLVREFENLVSEQGGAGYYAPQIKPGENIKLNLPDVFLKGFDMMPSSPR